MSIAGIQGQLLEVTVVACNKLKDTQWFSRQDPYLCLEYGSTKFRTGTCTDGDTDPTFQEKFPFTLIEGLRELNCVVWNSNALTPDGFIGSGTVLLQRVLSQGYDDSAWPLQTKSGRYAGEVRLILHYANALKPSTSFAPSPSPSPSLSPYVTLPISQVPWYSTAPPAPAAPYAPPAYTPPSPYSSYPPNSPGYQPSPYSAPQPAVYHPSPYPPTSTYPPPPQASPFYPPDPYPGMYPPRPY